MTLTEYLNLIPSANRNKPNFVATLSAWLEALVRVQDIQASMIPKFDIDVAVGDQLDILGKWIGLSRQVSIPIENVYFTWDGAADLGWDFGTWQPNLAPDSVTSLPDDAYRLVLKAKIAANSWDGTTEGAYAIWQQLFTDFTILIQDNQDMSYYLIIVGGIVSSLTLALLIQGYISLKPEGVRIAGYFVPIDSETGFGWDIDNEFLTGWDDGSWLIESAP